LFVGEYIGDGIADPTSNRRLLLSAEHPALPIEVDQHTDGSDRHRKQAEREPKYQVSFRQFQGEALVSKIHPVDAGNNVSGMNSVDMMVNTRIVSLMRLLIEDM